MALLAVAAVCAFVVTGIYLNKEKQPALHRAVLANDLQRAQDILGRGAGVNVEGVEHTTPLFFARSADMAKLLIQHGANVNAANGYRCTPLHFAAGLGAAEVVEVLVKAGAHVDARDSAAQTPLHWATEHIINHDTGFNDTGWSRTPQRQLEAARLLVERGADVNAKDTYGCTPLFGAVWADAALVRWLIAAGGDVRASSTDRHTPLHEAASAATSSSGTDVVLLLIQHGADPQAQDWQGKTPLGRADPRNQTLIDLLKPQAAPK